MTRKSRLFAVSLIALGMVPVMASAEQSNAAEIALLRSATVTVQSAGATALGAHTGVLAEVQFSDEDGTGIFEAVVVGADGVEWMVKVDAMTGTVVAQGPATAMDDQQHGDDDGDADSEHNDG